MEDISRLKVGEANRVSQFRLPQELTARDHELKTLNEAFAMVSLPPPQHSSIPPIPFMKPTHQTNLESEAEADASTATKGVLVSVNVYGNSGCGKSRLVEVWARKMENLDEGKRCLAGWAKLDCKCKIWVGRTTQS